MPRHQQVLRQWQILRRVEHAPQGVCIADLAAAQQLSERNLYRDLQALQEAGFPLYNDKGRWYLTKAFRKGNSIPLSQSEILALRCARSALSALAETPLFRALEGVIAKLDQALTPKLATFSHQMDEAFIGDPFGLPGYDEQAEPLEPQSSDCDCRKKLGWVLMVGCSARRVTHMSTGRRGPFQPARPCGHVENSPPVAGT